MVALPRVPAMPWTMQCLAWMADAAIKAAAVLVLAALLTLAMRRRSAAARHLVWTLALAAALALPLLSAVLPAWRVLPNWASAPAVAPAEPAPGGPATRTPSRPVPARSSAPTGPTPADPAATAAGGITIDVIAGSDAEPVRATVWTTDAIPAAPPTAPWPEPVLPWVLLAWGLGLAIGVAPLVLGRLALWRLARRSRTILDGPCRAMADRAARHLGLRRPVRLLASERRTMPMVWGILRPTLLLPTTTDDWPDERRWVVLLHEMAHIRRWDCLTKLVGHLACAVHWFSPLAWTAMRRLQAEAEIACDDLVLSAGERASDYADHLLDVASGLRARAFAVPAAIAFARPRRLEGRLLAILDERPRRRHLSPMGAAVTIAMMAALVVPIACLQPAAEEPPADSSTAARSGEPVGAGGRGDRRAEPAQEAPALGPNCPLEVTVYEVHVPAERLGDISVSTLAPAANAAAAFEQALGDIGEATPIYRIDQSVRLDGDRIVIGASVPRVASLQPGRDGSRTMTLSYQEYGVMLHVTGAHDGSSTSLSLELAARTDSGVTAGPMTTPVVRAVTMGHHGPIQPGQPIVIVSADAAAPAADGRAVAYAARIVPGAVSAPPGPAASDGRSYPLQAAVYELHLPPERLAQLDATALAAAGSQEQLDRALAAVGTVRPLYRMDQSIRLAGDRVTIGSQVPVVMGSRVTETGRAISTVRYQQAGAILRIAGASSGNGLHVAMDLEVSSVTEGPAHAGGEATSITRRAVMGCTGPAGDRSPIVLVSADAGSPGPDGQAVAYVAWIVVGPPAATNAAQP